MAIGTEEKEGVKGESLEKTAALKFGGKEYASAEDLGKAYESLQSEHGKWTQKYGDLEKQFKDVNGRNAQWEQWWQGVEPLWGQDVEDVLKKKHEARQGGKQVSQAQQAQQPAQQVAQVANQVAQQVAEQYDFYRPEDVAKFKQAVALDIAQRLQGSLVNFANAINQTLKQKETWYQNYLTNHLSLLRRALEQKLQNPNFNVDAVMENAARALGGQIDPIELGKKLLAAEEVNAQVEAAKKEAYAAGKRDLEQEYKNKREKEEEQVPVFNAPKFTMPTNPPGTRNGLHTLREKAAERLIKEFGPSVFTGR